MTVPKYTSRPAILAHIQSHEGPHTSKSLADELGISIASSRGSLRSLLGDGAIESKRCNGYSIYSIKAVQPRQPTTFKPLRYGVSALGRREGSNDHLSYGSRFN